MRLQTTQKDMHPPQKESEKSNQKGGSGGGWLKESLLDKCQLFVVSPFAKIIALEGITIGGMSSCIITQPSRSGRRHL